MILHANLCDSLKEQRLFKLLMEHKYQNLTGQDYDSHYCLNAENLTLFLDALEKYINIYLIVLWEKTVQWILPCRNLVLC